MILTSALGGEEGTGHRLHFLDEEAAMLRVTQGVQTGRSVSQLLVLPKSLALSCSPQQIKEQQSKVQLKTPLVSHLAGVPLEPGRRVSTLLTLAVFLSSLASPGLLWLLQADPVSCYPTTTQCDSGFPTTATTTSLCNGFFCVSEKRISAPPWEEGPTHLPGELLLRSSGFIVACILSVTLYI